MTEPLIFVVDDDADHLESLVDLISAAGHDTRAFADAPAALAAVAEARPGLILTDLRMPGMDGIALLAALTEAGHDIPVVVLTGGRSLDRRR